MKKLIVFTILHLSIAMLFAQNCSVKFSYTIGANNVVTFYDSSNVHNTCNFSLEYNFGDTFSKELNTNFHKERDSSFHYFYLPGVYKVSIFSPIGFSCTPPCIDTFSDYITIADTGTFCKAQYKYKVDSADNYLYQNLSLGIDSSTYYQWEFKDGSTNINFEPTHYYYYPISQVGNPCLYITNSLGCRSVTCEPLLDTMTTRLSEVTNPSPQVYVNTGRQLKMTTFNDLPQNYTVLDISGRELIKGVFQKEWIGDISAWSAGVYLVYLQSAEGLYKKKIVLW